VAASLPRRVALEAATSRPSSAGHALFGGCLAGASAASRPRVAGRRPRPARRAPARAAFSESAAAVPFWPAGQAAGAPAPAPAACLPVSDGQGDGVVLAGDDQVPAPRGQLAGGGHHGDLHPRRARTRSDKARSGPAGWPPPRLPGPASAGVGAALPGDPGVLGGLAAGLAHPRVAAAIADQPLREVTRWRARPRRRSPAPRWRPRPTLAAGQVGGRAARHQVAWDVAAARAPTTRPTPASS
jgi:hypothetical protein